MMVIDKKKYNDKIVSIENLLRIIGPRPRSKSVIMCHGTFDVVHPGHIHHLIYCSQRADITVASVTSDDHITKDSLRPYIPENIRALNLATLDMVDYVVIDNEPNPLNNLKVVQPDFFGKGFEYIDGGMHPKTKEELDVISSYGGEVVFTPGDVVYSSSKFMELSKPNLAIYKLGALMEGEGLGIKDLKQTLSEISNAHVHVIGDTIVDGYTDTSMIGGQTKTPTISVRYEGVRNFVGGAAIVAKHIRATGANVTFTTVLGEDHLSDFVIKNLEDCGVKVNAVKMANRPTTYKNAIICSNQRMLKIDTLDNTPIPQEAASEIIESIANIKCDAVVFSDFRHGIFSKNSIDNFKAAIPDNVFAAADSQVASRWGNICDFVGFDLVTPNEREARFSLADQDSVIRPLAEKLLKKSDCRNLILKLGADGLIGYRPYRKSDDVRAFFVIGSFVNNLVDAVGSGDALLAYATLAHLKCKNPVIPAIIGSLAAAVACEHDGNSPIGVDLVMSKLEIIETELNYGHKDQESFHKEV